MSDGEKNQDDAVQIIAVPNKIKEKVSMGGRIKAPGFSAQVLAEAEAHVENTVDVTILAADEDIERLLFACDLAEEEPDARAVHLKEVERYAEVVAGHGKIIGYDLLAQFAKSLAAFLGKSAASQDIMVQVARVHVDSIRLVFARQLSGDGGAAGKELTAALRSSVQKFL